MIDFSRIRTPGKNLLKATYALLWRVQAIKMALLHALAHMHGFILYIRINVQTTSFRTPLTVPLHLADPLGGGNH